MFHVDGGECASESKVLDVDDDDGPGLGLKKSMFFVEEKKQIIQKNVPPPTL